MTNIESLRVTFDSELYLMSSEDIRDFINTMSDDPREAIEEFCEWVGLEEWYENALKMHSLDIRQWLEEDADSAQLEEMIIADDEQYLTRSIRSAQGWNF